MATYKGIITGIGDKANKVNLISPQIDAKINNFIIGAEGIIDGLEINGLTLSAGTCVAQGYRGTIENNITLDTAAYVYGVFKINHDPEVLDEFYIETFTSAPDLIGNGDSFGDDILHEAGTYYLSFKKRIVSENKTSILKVSAITGTISSSDLSGHAYYTGSGSATFSLGTIQSVQVMSTTANSATANFSGNTINVSVRGSLPSTNYLTVLQINYIATGEDNNKLPYPNKAENAVYTDYVNMGGVLGSNVSCPTQDINDNSNKVANTEYVHNQIEEEVNYTNTTIDINYSPSATYKIGTIQFIKKAGNAIIKVTGDRSSYTGGVDKDYIKFSIPSNFLPVENQSLIIIPFISLDTASSTITARARLGVYKVDSTGKATLISDDIVLGETSGSNINNLNSYVEQTYITGWKTSVK